MSLKISVDYEKALESITKFKEKLKPEVVDKALDVPFTLDLAELKTKLLSMLNNEQKSKVEVKDQALGETQINIKKSDEEIIKHLTGVDLSKVSKTKDYNSLADGNVAVVSNKTMRSTLSQRTSTSLSGVKMPSGVNLRIPMDQLDSFESQQSKALNYYNNAIFVIVDTSGKANYYKNPGIDMSQYVKVQCSTDAGDTEKSRKRWDSGTSNRGFADWTILSEGMDRVKRDFVNMTDVMDKLKEGEYEEAKHILSRVSTKNTDASEIFNKIDDLKEKKSLAPSVEAYNNIVKLIKNLKLVKTVKENSVIYTLASTYDETAKDYGNFQDKIKEEANLWQISNEQKWIKSLIQSIVNLAEKSLR